MDNYVNFSENFMATFATGVTTEACTKEGAEKNRTVSVPPWPLGAQGTEMHHQGSR